MTERAYASFATLLLIALMLASQAGQAADSRQLGARTFVRDGGGWVQVDPSGDRFQVDARVITIKLRPGVARRAETALHESVGGTELRRARTGFIDVELVAGVDVFDAIDAYLASGLVAVAEPTTIGRYTLIPNDPGYGSEWHLPQIDAPDAWDTTTGDPGIIVAVLDSGTEFAHEDLGRGADAYENVYLNPGEDAWSDPLDPSTGNGVDDDLNGFVDDWKGWDFPNNNNDSSGPFFHGTAVAGMVGAKSNNGVDLAGVAGGFGNPGASILIGGVGDAAPSGAILDDAILYAADLGAHVIQLSLTVGQSAAIDAAIETAHDTFGMTIICASGNGGVASVSYPSSHDDAIAVGSTTTADLRSSFSNHGPDLEISAPGSSVLLLDLNDGTGTSSGTSFAAPGISGVVALMLSANPSLTNAEIRQILHDTADKVGGYDYNWNPGMPGHSQELGYGRVNANAAVAASFSSNIFADGFESGDTSSWSVTIP